MLYYYEITPGDPDHVPAYFERHGIVDAEPDEIAAIVADIESRHGRWLLSVEPVQGRSRDLAAFRAELRGELEILHAEVKGTPLCPEDRQYLDPDAPDDEQKVEAGVGKETADNDDAHPALGLDRLLGCMVDDYEMFLRSTNTDDIRAVIAHDLHDDLVRPIAARKLIEDLVQHGKRRLSDDELLSRAATEVCTASFADLLRALGWNTDEKVAPNRWFRLWTGPGGVTETALRTLQRMAPFVVAGSWLDLDDGDGNLYRLVFDRDRLTVRGRDLPADDGLDPTEPPGVETIASPVPGRARDDIERELARARYWEHYWTRRKEGGGTDPAVADSWIAGFQRDQGLLQAELAELAASSQAASNGTP